MIKTLLYIAMVVIDTETERMNLWVVTVEFMENPLKLMQQYLDLVILILLLLIKNLSINMKIYKKDLTTGVIT